MRGIARIYIVPHTGRFVKAYEDMQLFDRSFSFLDIDLSDVPLRIAIPDLEMAVEITASGISIGHIQGDLLAQE